MLGIPAGLVDLTEKILMARALVERVLQRRLCVFDPKEDSPWTLSTGWTAVATVEIDHRCVAGGRHSTDDRWASSVPAKFGPIRRSGFYSDSGKQAGGARFHPGRKRRQNLRTFVHEGEWPDVAVLQPARRTGVVYASEPRRVQAGGKRDSLAGSASFESRSFHYWRPVGSISGDFEAE